MDQLLQDIRFGWRLLWRSREFTVAAVLALALGIGATTAIFSVLDRVVLRPLPYPEAERLTMVWEVNDAQGLAHEPISPVNFIDYRGLSHVFEDAAAWWYPQLTLTETAREPLRGGEERTPRHSIESLDSLSVDIARMIDHDAAADLWDRFKRGERNVFTRRLYTLQGQQAFDEIRKKYRADREFKQTVDRYIGEFERLLDEVARDDRSQVVARTYLSSETGKVYTMLAHAAGRFD